MKALILAAGYATRLYPLTLERPKALLPVAGKPILEYTLDKIAECPGIEAIYLVTNRKFYGLFQDWLTGYLASPSAKASAPIEILDDGTGSNEDRLGSIGDLRFAIRARGLRDDLLVICSDKIFEFSLKSLVDFFAERREAVNTCFEAGEVERIRDRHGCAVADPRGRIVEFQEKPAQPRSTLESVAFYIFPEAAIPLFDLYLQEGNNPDAPGYFAQWYVQRRPMYAYLFKEACYDVGTQEAYAEVDRLYAQKRR